MVRGRRDSILGNWALPRRCDRIVSQSPPSFPRSDSPCALNEIARVEPCESTDTGDFLDSSAGRESRCRIERVRDVEALRVVTDEVLEVGRDLSTRRLLIADLEGSGGSESGAGTFGSSAHIGQDDVLRSVGRPLPVTVGLLEWLIICQAEDVGREQGCDLAGSHSIDCRVGGDGAEQ